MTEQEAGGALPPAESQGREDDSPTFSPPQALGLAYTTDKKEAEAMSEKSYEVDADMLGTEWRGGHEELRGFCEILQGLVDDDIVIVPITDGDNAQNEDADDALVSEEIWNEAIDASPPGWWR